MAGPKLYGLLLLSCLAGPLSAQSSRLLSEGAELERRGRHLDAATRYRQVLQGEPANLSALLGMERVLQAVHQLDSIFPLIRNGLARDTLNRSIRALELRAWAEVGRPDSVVAAARRWLAVQPESVEPYREWAFALAQRGDVAGAKRVLAEGADRLGNAALAQELAQLTTLAGEWAEAARQWLVVVRGNPALVTTASGNLGRAPPLGRDAVLGMLLGIGADSVSRMLAADLLAGWGRAGEGWSLLDAVLPVDPARASVLLQRFADRARATRGREGALVRGYALERLAQISSGQTAERARLQAAQAFADAGDLEAAERLLEGLLTGAQTGSAAVAEAVASLIAAMAEEGLVREAEVRFRQWEARLPGSARASLGETLAQGWIRRGELDRAEGVLGSDSTVEATALRGWIAVYRGHLTAAHELFRAAGPYAGSREAATQRTAVLVILERIDADTLPELGRALLAIATGDTAGGLRGLERTASRLPPRGGHAEVLGLAGELATAQREFDRAQRLLEAAVAADSAGPAAAAAELALAQLHAAQGRREVAMQQLEHLIVSHPESAQVPQARRLLDRLRGVVPET